MNTDNPMPKKPTAKRCGAHARTTGRPCEGLAMKNGRCRMHGGTSPGAPKGNRNALKHGARSKAEALRLAEARALLAESLDLAEKV